MSSTEQPVSTRSYRSPLRTRQAADTRSALLTAAHDLFTTAGWAGTGMRDVASAAGVATDTVYAHFSSKTALFQAVVDVAVVGDAEPIALAERAEFSALGTGTRDERIAAAARIAAGVNVRTAGFAKVLREAAHTEPEIAGHLAATRERQRRDVAAAIELIVGGSVTDTDRDSVWALTSPEVYLLLVESSGWTVDRYEAWLVATLRQVVPSLPEQRRTTP